MQFYDLAQTSLAKSGSSIVEEYIPLWMADGTSAGASGYTTSGQIFLSDGSQFSASATSNVKLHTLNAAWSATTKFALECTIEASSPNTAFFSLWDFTANTIVSASQVSTTSTTYNVVRSSQFALIPGHVYGVTGWASVSSMLNITDASLIVFG
jgi:hypothetical protein